MEYTQNMAYQKVKDEIEKALKGGALLNLKALRKQVRELSMRINALRNGAAMDFNMTLEKAEKVNLRIAELSGYRQAYREYIDMITKD